MNGYPQFRIVAARGNQFRGHIVGRNGKLVWRTEAYPTRAAAMTAVHVAMAATRLADSSGNGNIIDTTKAAKK